MFLCFKLILKVSFCMRFKRCDSVTIKNYQNEFLLQIANMIHKQISMGTFPMVKITIGVATSTMENWLHFGMHEIDVTRKINCSVLFHFNTLFNIKVKIGYFFWETRENFGHFLPLWRLHFTSILLRFSPENWEYIWWKFSSTDSAWISRDDLQSWRNISLGEGYYF